MNYALAISQKLERFLAQIEEEFLNEGKTEGWGHGWEELALERAIEETFQESGQRWRPWAANAKACRMGEIVLIVDSDTIVPEVCLIAYSPEFLSSVPLRTASEMLHANSLRVPSLLSSSTSPMSCRLLTIILRTACPP